MDINADDAKTYGFLLTLGLTLLKALQWLFTDKTKVLLLEKELAGMKELFTQRFDGLEETVGTLSRGVTDALSKGEARMQKHEDEIKGHAIQLAHMEKRAK